MKIEYKISYLSDGTKVKITTVLFNQLKQWEMQGIHITTQFQDELKIQDNNWLNSSKNYYKFFQSFKQEYFNGNNHISVEKEILNREAIVTVFDVLTSCTKTQKRRFLKHFMYGMSFEEIAKQENVSRIAVSKSVRKVMKLLIEYEQFVNILI